ncbi:hypothetical protein EDD37DRAFT_52068 [Exophiala viscosa]|uniref:uncharacterized protein n=1 Tax=Exophiala viscosa TaxID=2486360 RepID=UPI002194FE23|nr:hypothetical protein EDD37DRAFT_52068 [Exophiala viscosa]
MFNTPAHYRSGRSNLPTLNIPQPGQNEQTPRSHSDIVIGIDVETLLNQLQRHPYFDHYLPVTEAYLRVDDEDYRVVLSVILYLRNLPGRRLAFWRHYHPTIYYTLPPDLFDMITQMRQCKSWNRDKGKVIALLNSARTLNDPAQAVTADSRRGDCGTHLSPASATRSPSRESLLRPASAQSSWESSGVNLHQSPSFQAESICSGGEGTPASTNAAGPSRHGSRKAPRGFRFWCPYSNCKKRKKHYLRQGDFENHLENVHGQLGIPNVQTHLHPAPENDNRSIDASNEHGMTAMRMNNMSSRMPYPAFSMPNPSTPIGTSPMLDHQPDTPTPDSVGSDVVQADGPGRDLDMLDLPNAWPTAPNMPLHDISFKSSDNQSDWLSYSNWQSYFGPHQQSYSSDRRPD